MVKMSDVKSYLIQIASELWTENWSGNLTAGPVASKVMFGPIIKGVQDVSGNCVSGIWIVTVHI